MSEKAAPVPALDAHRMTFPNNAFEEAGYDPWCSCGNRWPCPLAAPAPALDDPWDLLGQARTVISRTVPGSEAVRRLIAAIDRAVAGRDNAILAAAPAPALDNYPREDPCCYSIHEFEQVCPRTGRTFREQEAKP